jgi:hypothetical protein
LSRKSAEAFAKIKKIFLRSGPKTQVRAGRSPFRHLVQKAQGGKNQKSKKMKFFIPFSKKHLSTWTPSAISPFRTKSAGSSQCTEGLLREQKALKNWERGLSLPRT